MDSHRLERRDNLDRTEEATKGHGLHPTLSFVRQKGKEKGALEN